MRELVLAKLKGYVTDSLPYGIPRYFDCNEEDNITDANELDSFEDAELLAVYEATIGFGG